MHSWAYLDNDAADWRVIRSHVKENSWQTHFTSEIPHKPTCDVNGLKAEVALNWTPSDLLEYHFSVAAAEMRVFRQYHNFSLDAVW